MSQPPEEKTLEPTAPQQKPSKPPVKPDRLAREAAALRANLLKRKDQTRKREAAKEKPDGER
jgi:hypothetical protein